MTGTSFAEKLAGTRIETDAGAYILLPARPDDAEFANGLLKQTMDNYVRATWDDEADIAAYYVRNAFEGRAEDTLVLYRQGKEGREPVGAVTAHAHLISDGEKAIDLGEIHLLPSVQGQGLGQAIISEIIAKAAPLPVTLMVLEANPARHLYERLGFIVDRPGEGDTAHRLHMIRR
ncbi:GNAT family N-acetyltransferase [Parvularcula marina]|uniref:N-acetyltransferase n=1 Tax=Parvularcula marina TaxID=2292771 RepID=A0A371R7L7_9PROT|nr:GNAT family N-acetyltransferase [Parvularcula marina]RFB01451.1 N-acetyltransferase [Parvularcula marina]